MILKEKVKQDLPLINKSSDKNKQLCKNFINNNINYKNIIYNIYKDDFEFLPIEPTQLIESPDLPVVTIDASSAFYIPAGVNRREEQRRPLSVVDAMQILERENLSLVEENKRLRGLLALAADRIKLRGA
jgi:hypothetical protein